MKKIMSLLLTMSLLLCANVIVYATEGDDGSNEPIATVGDVSETSAESSIEEESGMTKEPAETETTEPAEQSDESETNVPTEESETPETTKPTDESVAPEGDVSTGSSETSEEPAGNKAEGNMQPASNEEPVPDSNVKSVNDEEIAEEARTLGLDEPTAVVESTYDVNISWSGMCFTYHEKQPGEWNPNLNPPRYDDSGATPYWTSSDSEHPSYGTITVSLSEQVEPTDLVTVDFKFNRTFGKYVAMYFSKDNSNVKEGSVLGESLEFTYESPKEQSVYVIPGSGTLTSADFNGNDAEPIPLGNITVKITVSGLHDPALPEQPGIE